jgi:geranylgeranyl pyrophosphate synthase
MINKDVNIILSDKKSINDKLIRLIKNRCETILEKFGQNVITRVMDPKLLAALEDVKKYWKDENRPSLTFFSCEAVGGSFEISQDAALMFTLASSGFGIHDDILDQSKSKHLRMTILGLHGIDYALLVGDLLIVKAWAFANQLIRKMGNPTKIADVLETYGDLSVEICEAEFMETQVRRKLDTTLDYYKNVLWKEMAEFEACSRIGAMLGDGQPKEIEALADFGRRVGLISRLANEVEDCLNSKGDLLHRIEYESVPLPLLYAAKNSAKNYSEIEDILHRKRKNPTDDIKTLLSICFEAEAFDYMRKEGEKQKREADIKLKELKDSEARDILFTMVDVAYENLNSLCI